MNDAISFIKNAATDFNVEIYGSILENPIEENGYFIPIKMRIHGDGSKSPTHLVLTRYRKKLTDNGINAAFTVLNDQMNNIEDGLRSSLISTFPNEIRNSFMSIHKGLSQAWVDFKVVPDDKLLFRLSAHLDRFATAYAIPPVQIVRLSASTAPTRTQMLQMGRQISPFTSRRMFDALSSQVLAVPSIDWVNRQLTALQCAGLLVQVHDEAYALTSAALKKLGTRKERRSPDIKRMLALARRVEY